LEFETIALGQTVSGVQCSFDDAVQRAANHLDSGGLLAHPTMGVYGIGGQLDSGVEKSLAQIKDTGHRTGFVYLVSDVAAARTLFSQAKWSPLADRLAELYWPGGLTLVLDDGSSTGVAIRAEAHPVTRAVLLGCTCAISSTSLNHPGEPAAVTSKEACRVLSALPRVDRPVLFLDSGLLPGPPPSTLLLVRGESFKVLREGSIDLESIKAAIG